MVGAAEQSVAPRFVDVSGATRIHLLLLSRSRSARLQRAANPNFSGMGSLSAVFGSVMRCTARKSV